MNKKVAFLVVLVVLIVFGGWLLMKKRQQDKQLENVPSSKQQTLRLILSRDIEDMAFLDDMARDNGFYAKNNLNVEDVYAAKDFTSQLLAGGGDVTIASYTGSLSAYLNGGETRGLGNLFTPFVQFGLTRFPRGEFQGIKKIAVNSLSGDSTNIVKSFLKQKGVDVDTLEFIAVVNTQDREDLLAKGDIDMTMLSSEKDYATIDPSKNFTVYEPSELSSSVQSVRQITTTQDVISQKPEALSEFVAAIYQTLQFVDNNPDVVKKYLQTKEGLTSQRADAFYQRYLLARKNVSFVPTMEVVNELADSLKKSANITSDRNLDSYLYPDFAKAAVGSK